MKENGSSYRLFFETAADGMLLAGGDGKVIDANRRACDLLRRTREEVVGLNLEDLSDPSYPILGTALSELREAGNATWGGRLLRGDGASFPAEVSVVAGLDGGFGITIRAAPRSGEGEKALRASAAEYRALVEDSPDAMAVFGPDNTFRYANPAFEMLLGYKPEELIGLFVPDIAHPEDLARGVAVMAGVQNGSGGPARIPGDFRYRHKDGHWVYLETTFNNLTEDPEVRGFVVICRDVTERVLAEERLKESEERYRALAENALDFVVVQKPDSTLSYVSPSIKHLLGYEPEEVVGTLAADHIHPEDLEWAWPVFYKQLQTPGINETVRIRYRHKNGSWRWFESACNNQLDNPAVEGLVFNCREITEKLEAEEALRESEERFRALTENAQDFIALADENNVALYANPAIEQIMGYTPEEFVGTLISGYIHPDDLEEGLKNVAETLPIPGPNKLRTIRYRHKDGSAVYLEVIINNRLEDPFLRGIVCNCRDVTERVEAEKKLKESEERHRALTENAADLTVVQRPDMTISYASPSMKRVLGYRPEEWVGVAASEFIHPEDLGEAREAFQEVVENPGAIRSRTLRYRHKDGSWRYLEAVCNNQLENPAVEGLIFNCRDVTDRLLAERELRESEERLARSNRDLARSNKDLEQFAYVVSHGLRSPLRGVVNASEALLEDHAGSLDDEGWEYLQSLRSSSRHMEQLVKDLLDLSRVAHTPLLRETVDLSAVARAIATERRKNWPEREVEFVIQEGLAAEGDSGLLQVVLENLLGNAWKYTRKRARARIEFGLTKHEGAYAYFVRDNGAGFDMARAGQLFELFRRLHRASEFEGTGIGLTTVERVVGRHGGRVWAEGEEGRGATFFFTLGQEDRGDAR